MTLTPSIAKDSSGSWRIDFGTICGKRRQFFAKTKELAEAKAREKQALFQLAGADAISLTPRQLLGACMAYRMLPADTALDDVVSYWIEKHQASGSPSMTVEGLFRAYIASRQRKHPNYRPRSLSSILGALGRYSERSGATEAASVTREDLQAWVDAMERATYSPQTIRNRMVYMKSMWDYAAKEGVVEKSPMDGIDIPAVQHGEVVFLSVEKCEALMRAAEDHHQEAVAKLAIGLFAGTRMAEIDRMTWADVHVSDTESCLTVSAGAAKESSRRHTDILPVLRQWINGEAEENILSVHKVPIGPLGKSFDRIRQDLCRHAGIDKWTPDLLRHSFATYHVAMWENPEKTAYQLGHRGGTKVFYDHYRGLATKADAERFWNIRPRAA